MALISALCAVAFMLAPDATLDFFSAFMHGLDLKRRSALEEFSMALSLNTGRCLHHLRHFGRGTGILNNEL